jgi:hypothetical protein
MVGAPELGTTGDPLFAHRGGAARLTSLSLAAASPFVGPIVELLTGDHDGEQPAGVAIKGQPSRALRTGPQHLADRSAVCAVSTPGTSGVI